jgi:hypothetical protein
MIIIPIGRFGLQFIAYSFNSILSFFAKFRQKFQNSPLLHADPFNFAIYSHRRLFIIGGDDRTCLARSPVENKWISYGNLAWEIYRWICGFGLLIYFLVVATDPGIEFGKSAFFIILYVLLLLPQILTIRFPFFFLHRVCTNPKCDGWRSVESAKTDPEQHFSAYMLGNHFQLFGVVSMVISAIMIALCVSIPAVMVFAGALDRQYRPIPVTPDFVHSAISRVAPPDIEPTDMCVIRQFQLSMIDLTALASFVYYNFSEDNPVAGEVLKEFFDPELDPNLEITEYGQLNLTEAEFAGAAYFNFDLLNLTVFVIRGTIDPSDVALDAQFFMSSLFLTLSMPLSMFVSSITPATMTAIRSILSFPIVIMKSVTLIDKYMNVLTDYYDSIPKLDNVLFTGHSLGGGFAKVFGHIYGKQSVAVSGPGITLFLNAYPKAPGTIGDSLLAQTDIIPDHDIVPRVEVSGGVAYRVFCSQGAACHAKWHTLCMMGIMCGTPHEKFCRGITDANFPKIWDSMVELANGG